MNTKEIIITVFIGIIILMSIFTTFMFISPPSKMPSSSSSTSEPTKSTIPSINDTIYNYKKQYPLIAFVKPVFTAAAYNGFYSFYANPIPSFVSCLTEVVPDTWGSLSNVPLLISTLVNDGYPSNRITIINDSDVHAGRIFNTNGTLKYDTLVFTHNEYVTMEEYQNVINFIAIGGNVIVLNGNAFYAEVAYNDTANTVTLVYGHGWQFDGHNATKANYWRFYGNSVDTEDINWLGSRFTTFNAGDLYGAYFRINSTNPNPIVVQMFNLGYIRIAAPRMLGHLENGSYLYYYESHEENTLVTKNAHIIADWKTSFHQQDYGLKIYEIFPAGVFGGSLIHFGFYGTDILPTDYASRLAFLVAVRHQAGYYINDWVRYPMDGAILNDSNLVVDYTSSTNNTETILNGISLGHITPKTDLGRLSNGEYNLTVIFKYTLGNIIRSVHFYINNSRSLPSNATFANIMHIIPVITKINETTADIIIPRVQSGYEAFVQTTYNSGHTWQTQLFVPFPANSNESIVYLTKDPKYLDMWYRVGIRNTTISYYIPYIRTYQWDNVVIDISATNITNFIQTNYSYFVNFKISQYISGNISTFWTNKQNVILYKSNETYIDNISQYIITIPKLYPNYYTLYILVSLQTIKISFSFNLKIES